MGLPNLWAPALFPSVLMGEGGALIQRLFLRLSVRAGSLCGSVCIGGCGLLCICVGVGACLCAWNSRVFKEHELQSQMG